MPRLTVGSAFAFIRHILSLTSWRVARAWRVSQREAEVHPPTSWPSLAIIVTAVLIVLGISAIDNIRAKGDEWQPPAWYGDVSNLAAALALLALTGSLYLIERKRDHLDQPRLLIRNVNVMLSTANMLVANVGYRDATISECRLVVDTPQGRKTFRASMYDPSKATALDVMAGGALANMAALEYPVIQAGRVLPIRIHVPAAGMSTLYSTEDRAVDILVEPVVGMPATAPTGLQPQQVGN